jgi:hypothetical protein
LFLYKNDPLYRSPQNQQLHKTTIASLIKSLITQSIANKAPLVEPYTLEAQEPTINVLEVKLVISILILVKSNALRALESIIDTLGIILMEPTVLKLSTLELS